MACGHLAGSGDIVIDGIQSWPDLVGGLSHGRSRVAELWPRAPRPRNIAIDLFDR